MIEPTCKLRHEINNQLLLVLAKCDHIESDIHSPWVQETTREIKDIIFHITELMDSEKCPTVASAPHASQ